MWGAKKGSVKAWGLAFGIKDLYAVSREWCRLRARSRGIRRRWRVFWRGLDGGVGTQPFDEGDGAEGFAVTYDWRRTEGRSFSCRLLRDEAQPYAAGPYFPFGGGQLCSRLYLPGSQAGE